MSVRDEPPNSNSSVGREALRSEVAREETNLRQLEADQDKAKARLRFAPVATHPKRRRERPASIRRPV